MNDLNKVRDRVRARVRVKGRVRDRRALTLTPRIRIGMPC
jgi:hypothetical protein